MLKPTALKKAKKPSRKIKAEARKPTVIRKISFPERFISEKAVSGVVKRFEVRYLQVLDKDGRCDEKLMPRVSSQDIKSFFELMLTSRVFDDKALALQRQGRIGTYASIRGQEASQIGSAFAMQDQDWMFPSFREAGAYITRKTPMHLVLQYWSGDERGGIMPKGINNFTPSIPVGTHALHAVGFAWGARLRKDRIVCVAYIGDGATSEGDTLEAMNFAGVFRVPVVFLLQNNQWAISVPRAKQTAAETLAQKAIAFGFEGIQVDGNDVFAVYRAAREAMDKARAGGGPTLIECVTYRMGDHTTADDAKRYRDARELEYWVQRDPIDRLRKYMQKKGLWSQEYENKVAEEAGRKVEEAVKTMESQPPPNIEDFFKYTYAEMNQNLKDQLAELMEALKEQQERKE
ncbi:MAG: pyruvate dehydrogenase (acetyl-transferring) E1 component subunit alpha [Candidatus Aenigmarchaeota archaeon]|nr:pyruvate dehydrogenase (acetyl-transferring) E1 component subunit alpha [Candidatus Aenigmarchaeota archaeon]